MIIKRACYQCICNRCSHAWNPKGEFSDMRQVARQIRICPKCKRTGWNA